MYVYIVRCSDGTLYTGVAKDLDKRIALHNAGKGAKYTRSRGPVVLLYKEPADNRGAALRREAQLKRMTRKQKLAFVKANGIISAEVGRWL